MCFLFSRRKSTKKMGDNHISHDIFPRKELFPMKCVSKRIVVFVAQKKLGGISVV